MVLLPFGTEEAHAVVVYDRNTKICVIVANSLEPLPDAVATARSLKADHVHIVAPPGAERYVMSIRVSEKSVAYELTI